MKRQFTASIFKEADWYIAQCLEVDVASQGESKEGALKNLKEALELHFESPIASLVPSIEAIEVDISAA
ncbi:MAG TPA: type II toxin-antitoxin system HicB family antitoxin [Candidatus Obscuribacterales bacterium]